MRKGFDRLKGAAVASVMGLGLLGAGSGRAANTSTALTVTNVQSSLRSTIWYWVGHSYSALSSNSLTTTLGFSITSSDSPFGVYSAYSWTSDGSSNENTYYLFAYHNLILAVENNLFVNPGSTVDLTDTTVTSNVASGIVTGIDAQIQYYFAPDRPVVRAIYSLTNTTANTIDTRALVMGTHYDASGDGTVIHDTSNGDTVVEDSDSWVIVGPDASYYSAPAGIFTNHGDYPDVVPTAVFKLGTDAGDGGDNVWGYRYPLSIPAGDTVRIMVFNEMNQTSADLVAKAGDFESLAAAEAAGLLTGISAAQQAEIVNYGHDTDGDGVADNADTFPNDATESADTDGDGVGDNADAFPSDATETVDTDGDGVGDNADAFPNDENETVDTDGDGVGDNGDVFPTNDTEDADTDGDGVGDNADAFPTDAAETADSDGDGVGDNADAFPTNDTETVDTDGDGVGDNADAFPTDATRSVQSTSSSDDDSGLSIGATGTPLLLGLLGIPALLRRFRKDK